MYWRLYWTKAFMLKAFRGVTAGKSQVRRSFPFSDQLITSFPVSLYIFIIHFCKTKFVWIIFFVLNASIQWRQKCISWWLLMWWMNKDWQTETQTDRQTVSRSWIKWNNSDKNWSLNKMCRKWVTCFFTCPQIRPKAAALDSIWILSSCFLAAETSEEFCGNFLLVFLCIHYTELNLFSTWGDSALFWHFLALVGC